MLRLACAEVTACAGGLKEAYSGHVPYERDGLLLLHKQGYYQQGITPLALLWKDGACSRYVIDTDAQVRCLAAFDCCSIRDPLTDTASRLPRMTFSLLGNFADETAFCGHELQPSRFISKTFKMRGKISHFNRPESPPSAKQSVCLIVRMVKEEWISKRC